MSGIVRIVSASPRAASWLDHPGRARLLHAGAEVLYLENERREVVGLSAEEDGPLLARLGGNDRTRAVALLSRFGARGWIRVSADGVVVPGLRISRVEATTWKPRPDWERLSGSWFEPLDGGPTPEFPPALRELLRRWPDPAAGSPAGELIGRGPGLTPRGDDLIAGFFLGLWAIGSRTRERARALAHDLAPRTTALSAAYLSAAAEGEAPLGWHRLVDGLAGENGDWRSARRAIESWGATSGRAQLAAFRTTVSTLRTHHPREKTA